MNDSVYGKRAGDFVPWSQSTCQYMVTGKGPQIAPDVRKIPAYAAAEVRRSVDIGTYVGLPLLHADGEVFGTLCGIDPAPQPVELEHHDPLLEILAQLLSTILQTDLDRSRAQQLAERANSEAETDALTGLSNRRGWDRLVAAEEARYRRFGHTGSVIVLDLDELKVVNDRDGHDAGDAHITQAAQAVEQTTRDTDIVARTLRVRLS